jgi:hypothetical protein
VRIFVRFSGAAGLRVSHVNSAFVGSRKPKQIILKEQPWHIEAAGLFALGWTIRKVARSVGRDEDWVSTLVRQPFFRERLAAILSEKFAARWRLMALADDKQAPAENILELFSRGEGLRVAA